jgi:hypothetical protein
MSFDELLKLTQLPLVAAFIWFTLRMQREFSTTLENMLRQFNATLDKRQAMVDHMAEVVAANTQAMLSIRDCLGSHESNTVRARGEVSDILSDTQYLKSMLNEHHQYVVEKHK